MYSLGTRLGYEWGHFQEYASSPGQNEKTTGQGDVGGEVRGEGDAHDAHARITAGGRIGSARTDLSTDERYLAHSIHTVL